MPSIPSFRRGALGTLVAILLAAPPAATQDAFSAQDVLDVASVRLLDLSPDGRWAAVGESTLRDRLGTDSYRYGDPTYVSPSRTRLSVVDTRSGEATAVFEGPVIVEGVEWSPDGRRLALMEHRDGAWRALIWDRSTGALAPVRLPGGRLPAGNGPVGLAWSPDGETLYVPVRAPGWAASARAEFRRLTEGPVVVQSSEEGFLAWEALRRRGAVQSLWAVPVAGGEAREVLGDRILRDVAVLPDGRIRYDEDITETTSYERIFGTVETVKVLDPRTGGERTVIATTDSVRPTWSENGAYYAFTRDGAVMAASVDDTEPRTVAPAPATDSAGGGAWSLVSVAPGGRHVLARRDGDLYHLRVEGGDPLRVLDLPDPDDEDARAPDVRVVRWTGDASAVFLTRESRTEWQRALLRYDLGAGRVDVIATTDRLLESMTLSDDASTMVYASAPGNRPLDLWASSPTLGEPRRLTDANRGLDESALGRSELFSYMDVDGRTLYGVVYYPPDYEPGRRYPTVFNVYEEFFDDGFNGTNAFLASRGYVVVRPSVHLERGYPGEAWLKGVTAAANELIRRGIADPERLGVHGTSYGGYAVNLLVTQTDRFAAAVNISGKVDMISFYTDSPRLGVRNIHAPENSQDRIGATLWEQPQKYVAHSAIMAADRIDTPLLLITGQQDHNVPERTTMEMFYALRRLGKTVEWVSYVDGGHGMPTTDAAMVEDYHRRLAGWYDRWLKADGAAEVAGGR